MRRIVHATNCPCDELSMRRIVRATNCPCDELSMRRIVRDELSATNCPCDELSSHLPNRDPVDRIEKHILEYIHHCTQHVKKRAQSRIELAKSQLDEYKAFEDFEHIATPSQWKIHVLLKPKMKKWMQKRRIMK